MHTLFFFRLFLLLLLFLSSIVHATLWNSPHALDTSKTNTLFSSFSTPLKKLDPVSSYSAIEWAIIGQIYEPPLQYNYLKRPYTLEPLTLTQMPPVRYLNQAKEVVDENATEVAFSVYTLTLRQDIYYQNHPAFVKKGDGSLLYSNLDTKSVSHIDSLSAFKHQSTRQLIASDYAYAIKRMALRQNHSPILDTMQNYIVGLSAFSQKVTQAYKDNPKIDLREYAIEGVEVVDDFTLVITLHGKYPQFNYWLSMNFFAPIPWEADHFYAQEALIAKNITLNTSPIGTGAYYLAQNNPNRQMRLLANPNYHSEQYPYLSPKEAREQNLPLSLLKDANQTLPFIKEVIYSLEKESVPLWNKFLQGYYDASGVSSDAFDQAVNISSDGAMGLSQSMQEKQISLRGSVQPSIFYMAFNMQDPIVGGYSDESKKLRQAIAIAQNQEEYISIFLNERGIPAQGPIPVGIFGYQEGKEGTNPFVYDWVEGKRVRKPLSVAKKLLAEAGYPNGISTKTGKVLTLYYDVTATGPDDRALMDWRRKQFAKLGIALVIRATDYNRFQEKVRKAKVQLFSWGWNADYPDCENFLFLLYGGNAVVNTNGAGINSANYQNPKFDALFDEIKTMHNSPQRAKKIAQMVKIAQEDAPWVWGVHPKSLALFHAWYHNVYPHAMANNTLKYKRIDGTLRATQQQRWNKPHLLPLVIFVVFVVVLGLFLRRIYHQRQHSVIRKKEL